MIDLEQLDPEVRSLLEALESEAYTSGYAEGYAHGYDEGWHDAQRGEQ